MAALRVKAFVLRALRLNAHTVLNDRDDDSKLPLCPISMAPLPAAKPRIALVDEERNVCFYDATALFEFCTKCVDFRDPVTRRELNRVEVHRCARMQSTNPWVSKTICAYATAVYDARLVKRRMNAEFRQSVRSAVEVQQQMFGNCLERLRYKTSRWDLWLAAIHQLRLLDPHCAMHETASQMDLFLLQREINPEQHETEYGRDFADLITAFTRAACLLFEAGIVLPLNTTARITRLTNEQAARIARRRQRQQQRNAQQRVRARRRRDLTLLIDPSEMVSL